MASFSQRPRLVDSRTGEEHRLIKSSVTLGRHKSVDIVIPVVEVSRRHCRIYEENGLFYVEDLRTVNGTYVNGEPVAGSTLLQHGFHLKVAQCAKFPGGARNYVFRHPEEAERVRAAHQAQPAPAPEAAPAPARQPSGGRQVPIRHCLFSIVRRREAPRQIPVLKFGSDEVRFLNLFPLAREEPLVLVIDHPSWHEKIELPLKVRRITAIKTRPVFQVEAAVAGFGPAQQEACARLLDTGGGLLKYFS